MLNGRHCKRAPLAANTLPSLLILLLGLASLAQSNSHNHETHTGLHQTEDGQCGAHRLCENGGTCVELASNNFSCACPQGFTGPYCQQDVNECLKKPAVCQNGATCLNKPGGYQCICVNGWTGHDCSENVDDCSTAACMSGATCHDRVGHFFCECPPGKTGLLCQLDDGCFNKPCHVNATCDTSPIDGHYICTCPQGFTGHDCSIDLDECQAGSPCEHGGTCVNIPGSFKCECPRGFTGTRCEININECDNNPCLNDGTCLDEKGGYKCFCQPGFTGSRCQIDIDECAKNPCQNGAICKDQINSFRCICQQDSWGERCEFPQVGSNKTTIGGEQISDLTPCPVGWEGFKCSEDVDECATRNRCKNGGKCVNYPGSYRCDCLENYTGPNCEQRITACETNPCMNNANCMDSLSDGTYTCGCADGYYGQHCERESCLIRPCDNNGSCMKVMNKYLCFCPQGFSGQRCEVRFANTKPQLDPPQPPKHVSSCSKCKNGARCATVQPGMALCNCMKGFSGPDCSMIDLEMEASGDYKNECEIRDCEAKRNNRKCDQECNSLNCSFDGGDCTLGSGNPWAKCSYPLSCWAAFKDGKCDQECNTAECLYDGNDCASSVDNSRQITSISSSTSGSSVVARICDEKSDSYCLKNYANGICDPECNNSECGWDGADCENRNDIMPGSTEAQGLLVIRVEPAIEIGTNSESRSNVVDIELARLLRKVSVITKTILKIQNFRQVEEGRGTEIELIADNRKCQASCYNSTELIAKFLSALKARTRELDRNMTSGALQMTDVNFRNLDTLYPSQISKSATTLYIVVCGTLAAVCAVLMVISNNKQKVKEKAIVWFPEGFKPILSSRKRDPTDRKTGRNVSTLQALGGNFFRGFKRNERNINLDPNGLHSTDIDRCTATPNGGAIYHEPYDQYDQYGTYNGTESGSMVNNVDEPMTPTPQTLDPINLPGPTGLTPLMTASMGVPFSKEPLGLVAYGTTGEVNGSTESNVNDLLNRGARVDNKTQCSGETALHLAARYGRVDAAKFLLEKCNSQDVNAQDHSGRTPLHTAIAADSRGVFELLIRCRGTDLNAQTNDGTTPLILATRVGTYSMLEELIQSECEVTKSDTAGKTALHWAAATNNVDAIKRLLQARDTNKDAQDLLEETPLFLAAREGAKGAVEELLRHNANKDISDQMDISPIDIARSRNHDDIVRVLKEHQPPTPKSVSTMHASSKQMSPFSPLTDSNSNASSGVPPPPPSYHAHSHSGNARNGGRQAQKAALARSSSTKPLIAEANIIRNNLQSHCKSVMVIKTEDKDGHNSPGCTVETKTLGRRATQSTSSSHHAIQSNVHIGQFGALSANNVVAMPATPNSLTNSLSPASCSMMSPPTSSLHHLNSPTKSTPPININQMHRQINGHPNQVPPPAYDEQHCPSYWLNNNNPNMVNVNNNFVMDRTHGLSEVYNVPCLNNFMTPSPDSPLSIDSMASPPGAYNEQQYQNPNHPSLANQKQTGVFI